MYGSFNISLHNIAECFAFRENNQVTLYDLIIKKNLQHLGCYSKMNNIKLNIIKLKRNHEGNLFQEKAKID